MCLRFFGGWKLHLWEHRNSSARGVELQRVLHFSTSTISSWRISMYIVLTGPQKWGSNTPSESKGHGVQWSFGKDHYCGRDLLSTIPGDSYFNAPLDFQGYILENQTNSPPVPVMFARVPWMVQSDPCTSSLETSPFPRRGEGAITVRPQPQPTGKPRCSSQDSNSDMRGILKGGMRSVPKRRDGDLGEKVAFWLGWA